MENKGKHYEEKVVRFLISRGFEIVERNFRCYFGEIDIIAKRGEKFFVIEVKGGKNPTQRVNCRKVKKLYLTYKEWIKSFEREPEVVFLAAAVYPDGKISFFKIELDDCIHLLENL